MKILRRILMVLNNSHYNISIIFNQISSGVYVLKILQDTSLGHNISGSYAV
jgi:hypothetical protein